MPTREVYRVNSGLPALETSVEGHNGEKLCRRSATVADENFHTGENSQPDRAMKGFWEAMDEEYLDYNQLSRGAINDIKSLDRKDPRFLQMMLKKLQSHKENLDLSSMGHRVSSDEMIREEWLPIMPDNAKENWLKVALDPTPLWPQFEAFLEKQAEACRQRERWVWQDQLQSENALSVGARTTSQKNARQLTVYSARISSAGITSIERVERSQRQMIPKWSHIV